LLALELEGAYVASIITVIVAVLRAVDAPLVLVRRRAVVAAAIDGRTARQ
jgi:hypothetical protein